MSTLKNAMKKGDRLCTPFLLSPGLAMLEIQYSASIRYQAVGNNLPAAALSRDAPGLLLDFMNVTHGRKLEKDMTDLVISN